MKTNLKINIFVVLIFAFVTLSLFSTADFVQAADKKNQTLKLETKASVEAKIPRFQQFEIIEEPNINYSYLMDNYNGSREIIVEEALTVEILSNTNWHLRLNNKNLNSKVMIKESGQNDSKWQSLNSTTARFRGENGVQRLCFDLKFVLAQNSRAAVNNLELDLRHSLVAEVY